MNSPAGTQALCTLRFEGRRFEQHRFDVECTAELLAYRKLVLECAKELWRRVRADRCELGQVFPFLPRAICFARVRLRGQISPDKTSWLTHRQCARNICAQEVPR